jgi:hypothetical protein
VPQKGNNSLKNFIKVQYFKKSKFSIVGKVPLNRSHDFIRNLHIYKWCNIVGKVPLNRSHDFIRNLHIYKW